MAPSQLDASSSAAPGDLAALQVTAARQKLHLLSIGEAYFTPPLELNEGISAAPSHSAAADFPGECC